MCVIIVKEKNQKKPSKEFLRKAWNKNPDGAGFMYNKDNKVIISKGYMTFDKFYKAVKNLSDDKTIVYHFRIATHGATNAKGTHPFPISKRDEVLQKPQIKTNIGIAHNGIISMCGNYPKENNKYNLSDTQLFIRDYLTVINKYDNWYRNKQIMTLIDKAINSKMTVLIPSGEVFYIGKFENVEGYKCSNNYFNYTYSNNYYSRSGENLSPYGFRNYNYNYKAPIKIDIKLYKDTLKVVDKVNNTEIDLDLYNEIKITSSNCLILDGKYNFNKKLVDNKGQTWYYEDFDFDYGYDYYTY